MGDNVFKGGLSGSHFYAMTQISEHLRHNNLILLDYLEQKEMIPYTPSISEYCRAMPSDRCVARYDKGEGASRAGISSRDIHKL